jgi:asparagine synthase (glutamine-hydrolysing)
MLCFHPKLFIIVQVCFRTLRTGDGDFSFSNGLDRFRNGAWKGGAEAMCGIAAVVTESNSMTQTNLVLQEMIQRLKHRGPDGSGIHVDGRIGLGMTRLAIVGGASGMQPIWNERKTIAVICNGEIYNYQTLRAELQEQGHVFSTDSDVEVVVHLYEEHRTECVRLLEGTFAFVLWDADRNEMLACRDRVGVKPLYYTWVGNDLLLSSEIQAFLAHPSVQVDINPLALTMYLGFRFVPGTETLMHGVFKLPPAHFAVLRSGKLTVLPYWKPLPAARTSVPSRRRHRLQVSGEKYGVLRDRLIDAVASQLAPGVTSGVLLSGGLDSTALVALQKLVSGKSPTTYTVAFDRPHGWAKPEDYTELQEAMAVARTFESEHVSEQYSAKAVLEVLPRIMEGLDEPIADPTAIPLWLVSRLARQSGCRVIYSGEGLDELFNGYEAHRQVQWIRKLRRIPVGWRTFGAVIANRLGLPGQGVLRRSYEPIWKWYQGIGGTFTEQERKELMAQRLHWSDGQRMERYVQSLLADYEGTSPLTQMTYFDVMAWLPENTLTKSDKVSMAHGIELRVPFLDKHVVEHAFQFADNEKLRGKYGKYAVRQALSEVVPEWVLRRPKAGFPVPISAWLFGEWKDYVETTLLDRGASTAGLFRGEQIEKLFQAPAKQQRRAARLLWNLFTLEMWYRNQRSVGKPAYERVHTN